MSPISDSTERPIRGSPTSVRDNTSGRHHAKLVDYAIGIDLGTANTRTSVFRNGTVEIISHDGYLFMPSCVAFTPTTRLVGSAARRQAGTNPRNTLSNILRFIGESYRNCFIQHPIGDTPFTVEEKDEKPVFVVECQGKPLLLRPMEVLAMILVRAKKDAQDFLGAGCNVAHAVIAVPASFGSMQRQIVADAARAANLNPLRIISAVAYPFMTYATINTSSGSKTVMCVDFGATSLDVAIAKVIDGAVHIQATDSEPFGGEMINNALTQYMVKKHQIPGIHKMTRSLYLLRVVAERAKRELSSQQQTKIEIDALNDQHDFTCIVTRQELDDICCAFQGACMNPIERILETTGLDKGQIDSILLTGGSARAPWFQSTVSDYMKQSSIFQSINVDDAASRGAAMHAAVMSGTMHERLKELSLLDTMPRSIRIESMGGDMVTVYKKDSPTGSAMKKDFTVSILDNGTAALSVFEGGPYPMAKDYCFLGKLYLEFDPIPAGRAMNCTFSLLHLEEYNVFTFSTKVKRTGKAVKTIFVPATGELSRSDIHSLVSKMKHFEAIEAGEERRISSRNTLEDMVVKVFEYSARTEDERAKEATQAFANETLRWLDENPQALESEYREQIKSVQQKLESSASSDGQQESIPELENKAHTEGTADCSEWDDNVPASSQTVEAFPDPPQLFGPIRDAQAEANSVESARKIENSEGSTVPSPSNGLASESIDPISAPRNIPRIDSPEIASVLTEFASSAFDSGVERSVSIPTAPSRYTDAHFTKLTSFLRNCGHSDWSRVPRIYTVLSLTDQIEALDDFLEQGMTDMWLPFTQNSLPSTLSPTARAQFLQVQDKVLSKSLLFEKHSIGRHTHFAINEPIPFQVIGKLGAGAHSYVDKVVSQVSHREFARKLFRRQRGVAKDSIKSFLNELEVLKRVQHGHCVELMYSYTDPKHFALLMSPVADCNLSEYYDLAQNSRDKRSLLRSFLGCLAHALEYIHSIKIRHRDIKPQNILVKGDRVLLTDFGIALDWENLSRSTTTADSGKTWMYAAPEVARYEKRNTSADVWSLGCVFMEIVTVLKGETIASMQTFFHATTRNHRFYANTALLPQWAKKLRNIGQAKDDLIFRWVRGMLDEDAEERPTAATLYADIVMVSKSQNVPFCGSCCAEGAESSGGEDDEDDPWEEAAGLISPECS